MKNSNLMNDFKELAKYFRTSSSPLMVNDLLIITDSGDFKGYGTIEIKGSRLLLKATLSQKLPEIHGGYIYEQFWKIGGFIQGELPFWTVGLPNKWEDRWGKYTIHNSLFKIDRIHHITSTVAEGELKTAILNAIKNEKEINEIPNEACAYFTNYNLIGCSNVTEIVTTNSFTGVNKRMEDDTVLGEFGFYKYALIQKKQDCEVHLHSKSGENKNDFKQVFDALLQAVAFAYGQHTWPQWQRITKSGLILNEWVSAPRIVPRSTYYPITERACRCGDRVQSFLEKAIKCFIAGDEFATRFNNFLFLAREAGSAEAPLHGGLLVLCSVIEGLVKLLYEKNLFHEQVKGRQDFEVVRQKILECLERNKEEHVNSINRFKGLITSARFERFVDQFEQLSNYFNLPWEKMSLSLESWKRRRHVLAHGGSLEDLDLDALYDKSRIAGAINVFAASFINYSGKIPISALDNSYISLGGQQ